MFTAGDVPPDEMGLSGLIGFRSAYASLRGDQFKGEPFTPTWVSTLQMPAT